MFSPIKPNSIGVHQIKSINVRDIHPWINKKLLFYKLWAYQAKELQEHAVKRNEVELKLSQFLKKAEQYCDLSIAYGIFPCQADNNLLKLYKPTHQDCQSCGACKSGLQKQEILKTFFFERENDSPHHICDYFNSVASQELDYVGLQVVTSGTQAVAYAKTLKEKESYQEYMLWYGYCAALTEALAEWTHQKIRKEMGFWDSSERLADIQAMKYQGKRYSFGYNWCKDMSEQRKVLDVLRAEEIGISMNESDEMEPEFSTCAIIVHHPEAVYW